MAACSGVTPIRYRKEKLTNWLEIELREGKNRQVLRMTAKAGFPTLRLIRWAVGPWTLAGLAPGKTRELAETLEEKADRDCQPARNSRVIDTDTRFRPEVSKLKPNLAKETK